MLNEQTARVVAATLILFFCWIERAHSHVRERFWRVRAHVRWRYAAILAFLSARSGLLTSERTVRSLARLHAREWAGGRARVYV